MHFRPTGWISTWVSGALETSSRTAIQAQGANSSDKSSDLNPEKSMVTIVEYVGTDDPHHT
jgi:hypothetical protein